MSDASSPPSGLLASLVALFPEGHRAFSEASILGRAKERGLFDVEEVQLRDFGKGKHRTVDDAPCGGGAGMVLQVDVLAAALEDTVRRDDDRAGVDDVARRRTVVLLDPAGPRFTHDDAVRYAGLDHLVLVCGRYEGVDARVLDLVDEVRCIGDYVLTGGELAALVVLDATCRQIPGVLGNDDSVRHESFASPRLEHRQYTRPVKHGGRAVPPVLLSGDHAKIARARQKDGLRRTLAERPDLVEAAPLSDEEQALLDDDRVDALDAVAAEGER